MRVSRAEVDKCMVFFGAIVECTYESEDICR